MCGHRENKKGRCDPSGGEGVGKDCDMKDSICRLDLGKQMRHVES
jgi:hypothetical protein